MVCRTRTETLPILNPIAVMLKGKKLRSCTQITISHGIYFKLFLRQEAVPAAVINLEMELDHQSANTGESKDKYPEE